MKYAVKSKKKIVRAYCLGANSDMEKQLIQEGAIKRTGNGTYQLFSQEAVHGSGEIAMVGDYFKVDTVQGKHYPYPNARAFFEENHVHIAGDEYEQKSKPLAFWQAKEPMCEEIEYLVKSGKLVLKLEDPEHYFNAFLWGAQLSASEDASVVFYGVERGEGGQIVDISFNFVSAKDFEESYAICE